MFVDSVIPGVDATIVPALVEFYKGGEPVVDTTYGKGRFWKKTRPEGLLAFDLLGGEGVTAADHRHLPLEDASVGTLVYDPPHLRRKVAVGDSKASVNHIYNLASWDGNFRPFLEEAVRLLKTDGVLIAKLADELTSGLLWNHARFLVDARAVGLTPFDLVIKARHPSIRNPAQKQWRARRRHCFFVICKKVEGAKPEPGCPKCAPLEAALNDMVAHFADRSEPDLTPHPGRCPFVWTVRCSSCGGSGKVVAQCVWEPGHKKRTPHSHPQYGEVPVEA